MQFFFPDETKNDPEIQANRRDTKASTVEAADLHGHNRSGRRETYSIEKAALKRGGHPQMTTKLSFYLVRRGRSTGGETVDRRS